MRLGTLGRSKDPARPPGGRRMARWLLVAGLAVMAFGAAQVISADAADPFTIDVQVNGNTVTLSGTWEWERGNCTDRWTGWAVDWGDPKSPGHLVPSKNGPDYFVGTPTDNTVHLNNPPDCGQSAGDKLRRGTWGPISHTYSVPGDYSACAIMYDVHHRNGQLKDATGSHGIVAGGPNRNTDNSSETNDFVQADGLNCKPTRFTIPTPTPTPTATPTGTPTVTPTPSGTPRVTPPPPDFRCPVGTSRLIVKGTNDATYTDHTLVVSVTYTNRHYVAFNANLGIRELLVYGSGGTARYQFNPALRQGSRFQSQGGHTIQQVAFCYLKPSPTPTPPPTRTPPPCDCATPTPTPTPTPPPCNCEPTPPPCNCDGGSTIVNDLFGRTTSGNWGSANTGGFYTLHGASSSYSVANGQGMLTVPASGNSRGALLENASGKNVDIQFRVSANKVAQNGSYYVYAVARRNGNSEIRPRLIFNSNGTISVAASVLVNGSESSLGSPTVVPGLSQSANSFIWFRAQVVGSNPTTVRVKAWAAGNSQPAGWQWVGTSSHSVCQVAGSLGLRTYVSSGASNAPVVFKFDDYKVSAL